MGYYYGYYMDPTYMLVLIGAVLCIFAQMRVSSAYKKYARIRSRSGLTGAEAAQRILQLSGIHDVRIEHVRGELTDHYDPAHKVLRLSDSVYGSASLAYYIRKALNIIAACTAAIVLIVLAIA